MRIVAPRMSRAEYEPEIGGNRGDPRQCDWRFLLPEPPRGEALYVGGANSSIVRPLAEANMQDGHETYDLIAAKRPSKIDKQGVLRWGGWSLPDLAAKMTSNAQIYVEIDRPALVLPPGLLKRQLQRVGFTDVAFYWPKPGFTNLEMLMPLGDWRLQSYYLQRLFFGTSLPRRMLRTTLRFLARSGLFERVLPGYIAIARKWDAAAPGTGNMAPHFLKCLLANWGALQNGLPRPEKIQWVVLNGGVSNQSKIVCPLWLDDEVEPGLALKFQRDPAHNYSLEVEYKAISELQSYLPQSKVCVPRPCGTLTVDDTFLTVETSVPGKPLGAYLQEHPARAHEILRKWERLAVWLTRLHVNSRREATDAQIEALLFEPLRLAEQDLALSPRESEGISRLRRTALILSREAPIPLVYNHNDLGAPNVMCTDRGKFCGVIDWEMGGFGLPATDLIYFLERFGFIARGRGSRDELKGFHEIFFDEATPDSTQRGWFGSIIAQRWLREYCRRLTISPRWLPVLFGLCWSMHARNEMQKQTEWDLHRELSAEQHGERTPQQGNENSGHFRSCLRYYLEHMNSFIALDVPTAEPKGAVL